MVCSIKEKLVGVDEEWLPLAITMLSRYGVRGRFSSDLACSLCGRRGPIRGHVVLWYRWLIAVFAAHQPYVWIQPFYDGNGRVVRLMSYAALKQMNVGSELWSVARGLARRKSEYKALLQAADEPRRGDLDGRGTLSQTALVDFCKFFLTACIDQVDYMSGLLDFKTLSERMRVHVEEMIAMKKLQKGGYALIREALLIG